MNYEKMIVNRHKPEYTSVRGVSTIRKLMVKEFNNKRKEIELSDVVLFL